MSDDDITIMGERTHEGGYGSSVAGQFGIRRADRRSHLYAIGATGTGKSTLLERLIRYRREFDLDGQVVAYDLDRGRTRELLYDGAGRITEYLDSEPKSFSYDAAGALTAFTGDGATTTLSLDPNGNRISLSGAQGTDLYDYSPLSNQLLSVSGAQPRTYEYDAAGNVTSDGANRFAYDGRGRLIQVTNPRGSTEYRINGLGQRVAKVGRGTTYFVHDEAGRLIGEYDGRRGRPVQETVYLDGMPVAVLKPDEAFSFVYPDHLGTPRAIADTSGSVVWRWEGDPFGAARPNEDPDGDGRPFTYNLRFPGQYFDQETGLAYNYFRDYDPQTGRYIQGDPIGLDGGINLYNYAEGNPLTFYDPYGLGASDGSSNRAVPPEPGLINEGLGPLEYLIDPVRALVRRGLALAVSRIGSKAGVAAIRYARSAGAAASSREAFMNKSLRTITNDPSHPLRFLVDPTTGKWRARLDSSDLPSVQAGHRISRHSGAPERFSLEDATFNQVSNWRGETQGAIFVKEAVDIGGVPVERRTAEMWDRMGCLRDPALC